MLRFDCDQVSYIHKAIITLDITEDVINECISCDANLIISFHPLFIVDSKKKKLMKSK